MSNSLAISGVNTSPGWTTGKIPSTDEWNSTYVGKVDAQFGYATELTLTDAQVIGTLLLAQDPGSPLEAATRQYVDAKAAGGGTVTDLTVTGTLTVTGKLVLANLPTDASKLTPGSGVVWNNGGFLCVA
jgi:hypothetical protein